MILRTVGQVRRVFLVIAGFTLLLAGGIMLGLLAAEFVWARRLMDRLKREGGRFVDRFADSKK